MGITWDDVSTEGVGSSDDGFDDEAKRLEKKLVTAASGFSVSAGAAGSGA
jgi:hypothetical protein